MEYIASFSGGKDSTASIILAHENNEPLDLIIFCEVMFDKDTSGELPEHIDFIKNQAFPLFHSWGYKTQIIHGPTNYMEIFNHIENSVVGTDCRGMAEEPGGQMKLDFGRTADRIYINATKSVTLMGRAGGGGGKTGLYLLPVYTIAGNVIGRKSSNGGNQTGINKDVAPTLTGADRHAIAYAQSGFAEWKEGVGTLKRSRGAAGGGSETLAVIMERIARVVKYRVRRLTPLECERLDGFPDYWTRYGASGKEMSDNARYMALGNSIAVPCAERVFIGIKKAESEE